MKKRLPILLLAVLLLGSMLASVLNFDNHALASSYVGASTTGKFHYTSCQWAQRIRDDHRVYFESRQDALDAGYIPCKVCRP